MELFQWMDQRDIDDVSMEKLREELADVVIYCLSMANATGIDLASAVRDKVEVNAGKYPVEEYQPMDSFVDWHVREVFKGPARYYIDKGS